MKNAMTAVIVLVLASACMSGANPIAQKRAVGGVLMCTGANSTGQCNHAVHPMDKCVNVTTALYHKVVTFAPDGEEFYCYPYENLCGVGICTSPEGCTLGAISYESPFKDNLTAVGWGQSVGSFECYQGTAPSTP
ncbi:hypothetical protein P8C59_008129 [Phyllachora maydis]|uniref:Uncharacterized protein n=1 Tax=Phyllachora maydis TaxID=1825666 RepID=A0AAD9IAW1_9PEZI|nr:hypothetical protein P8C59_008129 [Phyllachora maydis]